ncbi:MAG: ribulose-5-phosphate 4-epimerase-like epimerase or aldolase [Rhodospirillales bacterium]|nr:ribulose-5-phosphate 4-epimerase-like epimerase or aldolase [Rhodospirillales bacterium]
MSDLKSITRELAAANRILAHEGVVDAYGHISVRHPDDPTKYLLSISKSPELVEPDDIMAFNLDSSPVQDDNRPKYVERPIHGSIYELHPHINSVVHNHAYDVIPFTITDIPLRPVLHSARRMKDVAPVWDIHDKFGDTDLLVSTNDQGRDLAKSLGEGRMVLMRGHGCAVAGVSIADAVQTSVYAMVNARILLQALTIGGGNVKYLHPGEITAPASRRDQLKGHNRAWETLLARAGVSL